MLLCALLLLVALPYFAFGGQPIFGFAAGCSSALLVEFIGAAANLVFDVDGNHSAGLSLHYFELLSWFGRDFDLRFDLGGRRFHRYCLHVGHVGRTADNGLLFVRVSLAAWGRF